MHAPSIQASAETIDFSQSLASRRHLPEWVNASSKTPRHDRTSKPFPRLLALMFSAQKTDLSLRAPKFYCRPSARRYAEAKASVGEWFKSRYAFRVLIDSNLDKTTQTTKPSMSTTMECLRPAVFLSKGQPTIPPPSIGDSDCRLLADKPSSLLGLVSAKRDCR